MEYVSNTDLIDFLNIIQKDLDNMGNLSTLTFPQSVKFNKLLYKKKLINAMLWYNNNKGNIRGFMDRLPNSKDKDYILDEYNKYNMFAYKNNKPSAYTDLIPGLNMPNIEISK
jgi:hypothetical protein